MLCFTFTSVQQFTSKAIILTFRSAKQHFNILKCSIVQHVKTVQHIKKSSALNDTNFAALEKRQKNGKKTVTFEYPTLLVVGRATWSRPRPSPPTTTPSTQPGRPAKRQRTQIAQIDRYSTCDTGCPRQQENSSTAYILHIPAIHRNKQRNRFFKFVKVIGQDSFFVCVLMFEDKADGFCRNFFFNSFGA